MRGEPLTMPEPRARLEQLRRALADLRAHADMGAQLRPLLAAAGSAVWAPSEDLGWRRWIERCGDELARAVLEEFDACLEQRAAELVAAGELPGASLEPDSTALSCTNRAQDAPKGPF
jgi:hypothetical protein